MRNNTDISTTRKGKKEKNKIKSVYYVTYSNGTDQSEKQDEIERWSERCEKKRKISKVIDGCSFVV